jgi:hypothetical protein
LGVKWADLYRESKVQETVFEMLTEQYELAKIQEAKEIPTVKVLSPPTVPEKRSFPPRIVIILSASLLSLFFGAAWILTEWKWHSTGSDNETKILLQDVYGTTSDWVSRSRHGLRFRAVDHKFHDTDNSTTGSSEQ